MNVTLGSLFVSFGLAASVAAALNCAIGLWRGNAAMLRRTALFAGIIFVAALGAFVVMERALITRDFTVAYVAENGSSRTPALYNFATLWSALEGSLILWALVLAGYIAIVVGKFRRRLDDPLVGFAALTLFVVSVFFFFLLVGPANPFQSFDPPPGYDGPGPNPLLQDHVLVAFHPPMLYLGYVGFTVPFAFAIAALATGRLGEGWLVETRRWTLFAWGFLTAGILLGAWWSYEVIGWGGYWAWDPVENASLLPWLTGTAYLHSVMVQERRGMLRVWNLSLAVATFALTILGTFITRSGVIDSVHAFADGAIGPVILGFFALVVAVSVGLIGWRGDALRSPGTIDSPLSREASFLLNNVLFGVFAFIVLLGTVWPLIVEAVNDDRISVGNPFFETTTMPIGFTLLFLMAVAPVLPWRKASAETLTDRLQWPVWVGALVMVLAAVLGARGWRPMLAFGLGGFAAGSALRQIVLAARRQGLRGVLGRTNGGMIVHLGVIVVGVAWAASHAYISQTEFTLQAGDTATFEGHEIGLVETKTVEFSNRTSQRAVVSVDGKSYEPAIDAYPFAGQLIADPVTRATFSQDIQLSLLTFPQGAGDPVVLRVTVQPLVSWLWGGGFLMLIGTVLAAFPGRRRRPTAPTSEPADIGSGAADGLGPSDASDAEIDGSVGADSEVAVR